MDITAVGALLDLARTDPQQALQTGREWLARLDRDSHRELAIVTRAMGIAGRSATTMEESIAFGRESVAAADLSGDAILRSEALLTLAGSLAMAGETGQALSMLDDAEEIAPRTVSATIQFQRGVIFGTRGEVAPASHAFSAAIQGFQAMDDRVQLAWTLHNRGLLGVLSGDLDAAKADLEDARRLHLENGHRHLISGVEHNLGLLAARQGDVPTALQRFAISEQVEREQTGSMTPIHASRCEVLLSVGLFREALDLATRIHREHNRHGRGEDEAEALLVASQASLLSGDMSQSLDLASKAARMFDTQGRARWEATATGVTIQARYEMGDADQDLLREARRVAEDLEGGFVVGARNARLLSGLIALDIGDVAAATEVLTKVARTSRGPVETRLTAKLATARLALAKGDKRGADAAARAGLRMLDQYQAALGASDIRHGVERHAIALATLGLDLALRSGRPRRVFGWMERTHTRALLFRPVVPADEAQIGDLGRLRKLTADLRGADRARSAEMSREIRRLQDSIRDRARQTRGDRELVDRVGPVQLLAALRNQILVEWASLDGVLWVVIGRNGRFRLREIGSEAQVLTEMEGLRFIMRRLAKRGGSIANAREVARRLDTALFGSMKLGPGPLLLIPTARLHAMPWSALPTCRSRPVTVSPSAELWYRVDKRAPKDGIALTIAGPELEMSDAEAKAVGALYPGVTSLPSKKSSVENVQTHLDGAGIAHIASHAFFQYENPMFSSLRLADGDLYVYDIERLNVAPQLVVLSACDSGFTETHAGDELMGLSSALLSMGTRSIIASVGLVPDSAATKDLMVALHRGLVSGLGPSQALHQAQVEAAETPEGYVAASSFICIGAG